MKILGIDPGLDSTGYGIIEMERDRVRMQDCGVITSSHKVSLPDRLLTLFRQMEDVIRHATPDVAVIEELYAHYRHPSTAILMGHGRAAACLACRLNNVAIRGYKPTRVKKAVVGKGNATKEQVAQMVAAHLGLPEFSGPNDITDALALALTYVFVEGKKQVIARL
ncbi:MAG: crossover junction endodeoxyribonuclease RuvC [Candidatus Omnitrophica bacterium]|nr:crossover junction endodeoxyribonuclease RuvC [Candidatus Omnitrophota bacterium]